MNNEFENSVELLLKMVNNELGNPTIEPMGNLDISTIKEVVDHGISHQIFTLIYDDVIACLDESSEAIVMKNELKKVFLKIHLYYLEFNDFTVELVKILEENNINYVVLKGPFLNDMYPSGKMRYMSDIDILVDKKDYERTKDIFKSHYSLDHESPKHDVFVNMTEKTIELHKTAIDKEYLELKCDIDDLLLSDTQSYMFNGINMKIPTTNNHFVFLLLHMIVHLKYSSYGLKQTIDLALMMNQHQIDFNYVEDFFKKNNLDYPFYIVLEATLALIPIESLCDYPKGVVSDNRLVKDLEKQILSHGVFGFDDGEVYRRYVIKKYFDNPNPDGGNKKHRYINFVFPNRTHLEESYSYLKKNKFLLPIAWSHRLIRYIFRKDIEGVSKVSLIKSNSRIGEEKNELLNRMKLE